MSRMRELPRALAPIPPHSVDLNSSTAMELRNSIVRSRTSLFSRKFGRGFKPLACHVIDKSWLSKRKNDLLSSIQLNSRGHLFVHSTCVDKHEADVELWDITQSKAPKLLWSYRSQFGKKTIYNFTSSELSAMNYRVAILVEQET